MLGDELNASLSIKNGEKHQVFPMGILAPIQSLDNQSHFVLA
jgi:hypothetical protein